MNHRLTSLKSAKTFISFLLFLHGFGVVMVTCLFIIGLFYQGSLHIDSDFTIYLRHPGPLGYWGSILILMKYYILLAILYFVRQFFQNILTERIFVEQNVELAKRTAVLLVIASFLGEGIFTLYEFSFFNVPFIVTALAVWALAKVLEEANRIAKEQEFTI
ncbi:DUF2975 domain-containing protein [Streptococcus pneumoniae]